MPTALIVTGQHNGINEAIAGLQQTARAAVLARHGNVAHGGPQLEAQIVHEMIRGSVTAQEVYKAIQGLLAAYVFREHLWVHLDNLPDNYDGFRMFLSSAGLGSSTCSELAGLGYLIVPFCDQHGIPIDNYIGPGEWGKTRDTLTALKAAVADEDPDAFRAILRDIDKTKNAPTTVARAALREKYRSRRSGVSPGHGTTARIGNAAVLIVLFEDSDALEKALTRVGSLTEWDLRISQQGRQITIEG